MAYENDTYGTERIKDLKAENERLLGALARIAYSDAQTAADGMKMRDIATATLNPDKKHIYDPDG